MVQVLPADQVAVEAQHPVRVESQLQPAHFSMEIMAVHLTAMAELVVVALVLQE